MRWCGQVEHVNHHTASRREIDDVMGSDFIIHLRFLKRNQAINPGHIILILLAKDLGELTEQQRYEVTKGAYRCLPVHPTQLYSSLSALLIFFVLLGVWHRGHGPKPGLLRKPGLVSSLMLVLYGVGRFFLEAVRDDNRFEWYSLTVSQLIAITLVVLGLILLGVMAGYAERKQQT